MTCRSRPSGVATPATAAAALLDVCAACRLAWHVATGSSRTPDLTQHPTSACRCLTSTGLTPHTAPARQAHCCIPSTPFCKQSMFHWEAVVWQASGCRLTGAVMPPGAGSCSVCGSGAHHERCSSCCASLALHTVPGHNPTAGRMWGRVLAACDCTPERPACNSARHWTAACPYPAEHASPQPSTMSCKHVAKRAVSSAALAAADMLPGGWYMRRSCQQELLLQPHRTTGRTSGRRRYCCLLPQLPHNAPITRLLCPQRHGNPNMAVAAWRVLPPWKERAPWPAMAPCTPHTDAPAPQLVSAPAPTWQPAK
jgi:hypothetical protein